MELKELMKCVEVGGINGLDGIDRNLWKSVELMEFKEAVYQKALSHAGRQGSRRTTTTITTTTTTTTTTITTTTTTTTTNITTSTTTTITTTTTIRAAGEDRHFS